MQEIRTVAQLQEVRSANGRVLLASFSLLLLVFVLVELLLSLWNFEFWFGVGCPSSFIWQTLSQFGFLDLWLFQRDPATALYLEFLIVLRKFPYKSSHHLIYRVLRKFPTEHRRPFCTFCKWNYISSHGQHALCNGPETPTQWKSKSVTDQLTKLPTRVQEMLEVLEMHSGYFPCWLKLEIYPRKGHENWKLMV